MTSSVMFIGLLMRAARLLQILLLLQNRGRMTSVRLAEELEVSPRTILRDMDAMTEAGLPVIVFPGQGGGIELGFDYRTRLTGLDTDEARAMGVILSATPSALLDLGLGPAADRARAKIWEAFPDQTRAVMVDARTMYEWSESTDSPDKRRAALALAVREGRMVRLRARSSQPQTVHPVGLVMDSKGWFLRDALTGLVPEADWGDVNISTHHFAQSGTPKSAPAKTKHKAKR